MTIEKDSTGKNYIGLTEGTFKQLYRQHKLPFRNRKCAKRTELAKHIWKQQQHDELVYHIFSKANNNKHDKTKPNPNWPVGAMKHIPWKIVLN